MNTSTSQTNIDSARRFVLKNSHRIETIIDRSKNTPFIQKWNAAWQSIRKHIELMKAKGLMK